MVDVYNIWIGHGVLKHRAILSLKFKAKSPIHVGSGARGEALQYALMLRKGEILIPSSTWKGVFRRISELLANTISEKPTTFSDYEVKMVKAHREEEKIKHVNVVEVVEECLKNVVKTYGVNVFKKFLLDTVFTDESELSDVVDVRKGVVKRKVKDVLDKLDFIAQLLCPICRLYGAPSLKGKIVFTDTIIPRGKYVSMFRTHVGIDRESETRSEHALYSIQLISPKEVELEIVVNNVKPGTADATLWATTLNYVLNEGIVLGMRKSVGLGVLKVEEESKVYVNEFENLSSEDLLKALTNFKHKAKLLSLKEYVNYLKGE